jgi:hypothetical protein
MTATPSATCADLPAAVALAMYEPSPTASICSWPQLTASATIYAFHDPPDAVSAPVT